MNTLTESIDNMLLQLDETPDNRVLIGICFDALLEANREKEAIELECRCWLKAKKREINPTKNKTIKNHAWNLVNPKYQTDLKPHHKNWLPVMFGIGGKSHLEFNYENNAYWGWLGKFSTEDEAYKYIYECWNTFSNKQKDELWLWEPPT